MKLSKFSKKVIAIVMALALVFVGNYFVPESTDADVTMQTLNDTNFTSIQKVYEGGNLTGEWFQTGGYESYVGYWNSSAGQAWIDSSDSDHIKVQQTSSNWYGPWAFQIRKTVTGLTSGATYTYTVNLNANKADGKYITSSDETQVAIAAGDQTVTITEEANSSGEVTFTVGAGYIGTSVVMDFSNPVVKDSNGTQVYPEVTPTESGTETETQTER